MPKAKVGDINIYYKVRGKGEPVVLMAGGGGSIGSLPPRVQEYPETYFMFYNGKCDSVHMYSEE